jgi:hypothetical protein
MSREKQPGKKKNGSHVSSYRSVLTESGKSPVPL